MTENPIWKLKHPIPTDEDSGKEVTKFTLRVPRIINIQQLILAIGADTLSKLFATAREGNPMQIATNADNPMVAELIKSLLQPERFAAFNEALAKYLGVEVAVAEQIEPTDLWVGVKKLADFYPNALEQLDTVLKSLDQQQDAPTA